MTIPRKADEVIQSYLCLVDDACPGLVAGMYLYGSLALDDFHPGCSDIDFAVVADSPYKADMLRKLSNVHRKLIGKHPQPHFDGIYVTWDELAAAPSGSIGPHVHEGNFATAGTFERLLVTWHTLAQSGVTARGPNIGDIPVATNSAGLAKWTHDNLDGYWRDLHQAISHDPEWSTKGLDDDLVSWTVLGVCRLHYTLATGRITSKSGAGAHAKHVFSARWHSIIDEALRIRHGTTIGNAYDSPTERRTELLAFTQAVIADAHQQDPRWRPSSDTA